MASHLVTYRIWKGSLSAFQLALTRIGSTVQGKATIYCGKGHAKMEWKKLKWDD